jgi:hypothetical protein
MKTSPQLKVKNATHAESPAWHRRHDLARRIAAVRREWSARERSERAGVAEQLQCWLFASIAAAGFQLPAVASAPVMVTTTRRP